MGKYKEAIQKNITKYRERKNMSKAELARKCCVSKPTVTNWESGRNSLDIDMLFVVAKILDVSVDTLADRMPADFTDDERKYIKIFRSLDDRGKSSVLETLNREYGYSKKADADFLSA